MARTPERLTSPCPRTNQHRHPTREDGRPTQQSGTRERRDGVDGGAIITIDLTIGDRPIRLATLHQGFDDFTADEATSGIDAAIEALRHVVGLVNTEIRNHLQDLADGSFLSHLIRKGHKPIPVRVIEYTIDDGRAPEGEHYRLVTTILDPQQAPALELAELYAQRWEFENTLDEFKTPPARRQGRAPLQVP